MLTESSASGGEASYQFLSSLGGSSKADELFYKIAPEFDDSVKELLRESQTHAPAETARKPAPTKYPASSAQRGLTSYYGDISKFKPFTRDEEKKIFRDYGVVKKRIKKLEKMLPMSPELRKLNLELLRRRNEIVQHNLRFVVKLAKTFWMDGNLENFENLMSAGNLGLIRAVDKFDLKHGTRFLSYAAHWIALEIRCELANSHLIKVPVWYQKTIKKLLDSYKELVRIQPLVTPKALARHSKVPLKIIAKLNDDGDIVTYEHIRPTKKDVPYCEVAHHSLISSHAVSIADTTEPVDAESAFFQKSARVTIEVMLDAMKKTGTCRLGEGDAIRSVFGLGEAADAQNLRQVSNVTNISSERVRQLREKGLKTLRRKMRSQGITSTGDLL